MKNYKNIMMVKEIGDSYQVKTHTGTIKEYTILNLPAYILKWMDKHSLFRDSEGYRTWI